MCAHPPANVQGVRGPMATRPGIIEGQRDHFAFLFAGQEIVVVLHGNKTAPAIELLQVQGLGELPGVHGRSAEIAHLAGLHQVVQRLQGFLPRSGVVIAMDLVQVDVVGAQALERMVDFLHDRLARQAAAVRAQAHGVAQLGRDDDRVAIGVILDRSS